MHCVPVKHALPYLTLTFMKFTTVSRMYI